MKANLIEYTGKGNVCQHLYAAAILCAAKDTRLTMHPDGARHYYNKFVLEFNKDSSKMPDVMMDQLSKIADTIPSCWEFLDVTFLFEGVTRAFTHQLVRTRTASFAQQTMRVLDVDGWEYLTGPSIEYEYQKEMYSDSMESIDYAYKELIKSGAKIEDARGLLPTNIKTNIMMKMNFRTFVDLVRKRRSPRVQGEYREAVEQMCAEVLRVWPWASLFIDRDVDHYFKVIEDNINALDTVTEEQREQLLKAIHKIREGGK